MRRRNRHDIVIELTSLLDVIMIIIFMVMAQNSRIIADKQNTVDSVRAENSELHSEVSELENSLDSVSGELAEAQAKLDEGDREELLDRLQSAESLLQGYKYLDDVVIVLNVTLENKYNNTVRYVGFSNAVAGSAHTSLEIRDRDDLETAMNKLRVFIADNVKPVLEDKSGSTIAYIVFTCDASRVYHDDFAAVEEVLREAENRLANRNIRYRINPIE